MLRLTPRPCWLRLRGGAMLLACLLLTASIILAQQDQQQPDQQQQQDQQQPTQEQPAQAQQQPAAQPQQQNQQPADDDPPVSFRIAREASMFALIDLIARQLEFNYTIDPAVADGSVTINTYGELRRSDLMPLLESVLRMNGAVIVRVGKFYRVLPAEGVANTPIVPQVNANENLPPD